MLSRWCAKAGDLSIKTSVAIVDGAGELSYFSKIDQARSFSEKGRNSRKGLGSNPKNDGK